MGGRVTMGGRHPDSRLRAWACGWHWLSLDAVAVLIAYQLALQEAAGVVLPAWAPLLLGCGIWCGYVADRSLDVIRDPARVATSARHAFHRRHQALLGVAWIALVASLLAVGWTSLPQRAFLGGAIVALVAAGYVWLSPRRGSRLGLQPRWRWRKRVCTVAVLTLAGAWWALWKSPENPTAMAGMMGIFALAAWWSLSLLHHRLVNPLAWYRASAVICALGMLALATLFDLILAVVPVAWLIGAFFTISCWPRLDAVEEHEQPTESLLPPIVDGALAVGFFLFAWVL